MPKVSIIVPIYDVAGYLRKCIESVFAQTYKDYELILVDDGSPDECPDICDEYAKLDNRVKVIHKENGGLSSARNAGLDVAEGEYIYFLDSDDYIAPELLETVVPFMNDEADLVVFTHTRVDEVTGEPIGEGYHYSGVYSLDTEQQKKEFILSVLLAGKVGWEAWNRIFRKDVIERNSIRFADNREIFAEDLYFSLCYCAKAKKVVSITSKLYFYLVRGNSIMGKDSKKSNLDRMEKLVDAVYSYWRSQGDCRFLLPYYHVLYFFLINNGLTALSQTMGFTSKEVRQACFRELKNPDRFRRQAKEILKDKQIICRAFHYGRALEIISLWQYLLDGIYPLLVLKNRYIYKNYIKLNHIDQKSNATDKELRRFSEKGNRVYLLGTEEYGNLGDHQINESVISFLQNSFPQISVFEVTRRSFDSRKDLLKKYIQKEDLIILSGGGNVGDQYPEVERVRREIILTWPENPKIVFPQTVYFTNMQGNSSSLEQAKQIYRKENNVLFCAREKVSFDFAQQHFSCDRMLIPDIVLTENIQKDTPRMGGILLCLRSDVEGKLGKMGTAQIKQGACRFCDDVQMFDTQLLYHVSKDDRKEKLNTTFTLWQNSKLVITDRLHGMVFSAITGTPCIALGNYNHKIKGTYDWISYLPYIKYVNSIDEAVSLLPQMLAMEPCKYDNVLLQPYYDKLREAIREGL